jgi:hypothetical protein
MVLDEMDEEMAGVPRALEAPATPQNQGLARSTAPADREAKLDALELKHNAVLLRLMRQEVRLRKMLWAGPGPSLASATDDATIADVRIQRSESERK